jgi:hypothetical protein
MSPTTLLLLAGGVYIAGGFLACCFVHGACAEDACTWRCQPRRRMTLAEQMQGDGWRWN